MADVKRIEYKCIVCGRTVVRSQTYGLPDPGKCPRKPGDKPHTWRKNRELN